MRTHREAVGLLAVDVLSSLEAGAAGNVAYDEPGTARQMLGRHLGEQAGDNVVAATGPGADDEVDGLALEVDVLGGNVARKEQDEQCGDGKA